VLMSASLATANAGDVLLVFSELGQQPALGKLSRQFREHLDGARARGGGVISVTRHTANPLRAHADMALLVSAHDERPHIEPLLYQSALRHLLDLLFVLLCEQDESRLARLVANHGRIQSLLEP
jgi:DNA-binding MurR/RpiR family transcriptional regulator